jgi:hypothetical protein
MYIIYIINQMTTLLDLVDNRYTDKNTWHSYLPLYEELLHSKKESAKNVIEIGIGNWPDRLNGGGTKLWHDYFLNATIWAFDIIEEGRVLHELVNNKRVKLFTETDAYDSTFFTESILNSGIKFDFIIDDGPHTLESMKRCIELYTNVLADDGILIIEDIQDVSWISELEAVVPGHLRPYMIGYDLRHIKGRYDDMVFVIDKSKSIL